MTSTPPTCQVFQQENVTISSLRAQIEQLPRIVPSELTGDEVWQRNGEYISLFDVLALLDATPTETPDYKALYHELLYEVANKVPGESRHESARRIIRQHETPSGEQASAKSVLDATETR